MSQLTAVARTTWAELKLFLREPGAAFFTLVPPLLLFVFNGTGGNERNAMFGGAGVIDVLVPGYIALVIATLGLTNLPGCSRPTVRADHSDSLLRDLATVATETSPTLTNLRLASHAAVQGRTAGVLAERQRLAHEIHDMLAQGFTSIVTQLEAAEQVLDRRGRRGHRDARSPCQGHGTRQPAGGETHRGGAGPEPLERSSLPGALRDLAARWADAQPDAPVISVVVDGAPARMPPAVDDALPRVAQEALTNVGRHASASQVDVTVSYLDDLVLLDIQNDGLGFDVTNRAGDGDVTHGGCGLTSMRERVALVGGVLVVESAPADGTTVAARVPDAAATTRVPTEEPSHARVAAVAQRARWRCSNSWRGAGPTGRSAGRCT